jgi:hypothetical protein
MMKEIDSPFPSGSKYTSRPWPIRLLMDPQDYARESKVVA